MGQQTNVQKSGLVVGSRGVGFVAGGYALHRIRVVNIFRTVWYDEATEFVDAILARGHFASMTNVSGEFVVKESVLA